MGADCESIAEIRPTDNTTFGNNNYDAIQNLDVTLLSMIKSFGFTSVRCR